MCYNYLLLSLITFTFVDVLWTLLLGLLASGIVSWASSVISKRKERYRLCIKKVFTQSFSTKDSGDVSISVKYKSKDVLDSLIILGVEIVNDGKKDIRFNSHFSREVVIKSNILKFIDVEKESSPALESCSPQADGTISLCWDILKAGESFKLNLIAETSDTQKISFNEDEAFDSLSFSFRADCLNQINKESKTIPIVSAIFNSVWTRLIGSIVTIVFLYCTSLALNVQIVYPFNSQAGRSEGIFYSALFDKYILLGDWGIDAIIPSSDMPEAVHLYPVHESSYHLKMVKALEIMMIIAISFVLITTILFIISRIFLKKKRKE